MKKILLLILLIVSVNYTKAQMPDGSYCPDFTGVDLNGNTWNLYDLLDEGYSVVIDISQINCGPCYFYHTSGTLENLYTLYGPDGTNELMVLFIEGDSGVTMDQLNGIGSGTQGNWVEGISYPMINDASIAAVLTGSYFPTIYTVCPNRIVTETGMKTTEDHYAFIQNNYCGVATFEVDPLLMNLTGSDPTCSDNGVELKIMLQNFGLATLENATILISGGVADATYEWSGNLNTYEMDTINLGNFETNGATTFNVSIVSTDDNVVADSLSIYSGVAETLLHIRIEILFDFFAADNFWSIEDEEGNVMASTSQASYYGETDVIEDIYLDSSGCYLFTFYDSAGDGMMSEFLGESPDTGHCYVYGLDANNLSMGFIYYYDGIHNLSPIPNMMGSESRWFRAMVATSVADKETPENSLIAYPNPTQNILNIKYNTNDKSSGSIDVINAFGAVVLNESMGKINENNTFQIDLSALPNGLYMVNLKTNDRVITKRVSLVK